MTALMNIPLRQVKNVQQLLMSQTVRDQIGMVATKTVTPERMMRVVANAIRRTPSLQECEPMSFLGAMMFCSQMGLEPQTPLGLAYLIPFNKSVKVKDKDKNGRDRWEKVKSVEVVIGYKGFKELARRSGLIEVMHGDIVFEGDVFSHEYGSNQHLKHVPCGRRDKPLGAYFFVRFKGGEGHIYMTKAEIEAHRDRYSKGWQDAVKNNKTEDSPWAKDWEAMWIKTPCRRLLSRGDVPLSVEMIDAMNADESDAVDFSQFVFDPSGGPVFDAEPDDGVDAVDAVDVVEVEKIEKIEKANTQTADAVLNNTTEKAPAEAKAKREPEKAQDQADMGFDDRPRRQKPAAEPDISAFKRLADIIAGDLMDGRDPDELLADHSVAIESARTAAPEIYATIIANIEDAR